MEKSKYLELLERKFAELAEHPFLVLLEDISMKGLKAPFTIKIFENGDHYPMEHTALVQLIQNINEFVKRLE